MVAPACGAEEDKAYFLEKSFALADLNGDGTLDEEEFIEFYSNAIDAIEQEQIAREAFSKYGHG